MSKILKQTSGEEVVKILCNRFAFQVTGKSGSHVRLSKTIETSKIGTVVPLHPELKIGTLRGVLKLAKVDPEEFAYFL